ncbi:UNVERIFIED_CONTAM: hypothetical protein FKN15_065674, partial [Acipenser sinensis]
EMSGFDSLNPDFYQTSYSIDDQAQGIYDSNNAGDPYSNKQQYGNYNYPHQGGLSTPGVMQPQQPYTGQIYQPTFTPTAPQSVYGSSFEDEPPLLEVHQVLLQTFITLVTFMCNFQNLLLSSFGLLRVTNCSNRSYDDNIDTSALKISLFKMSALAFFCGKEPNQNP